MVMGPAKRLTQNELMSMMEERFGKDPKDWAFVCPACGDVATARDFKAAITALGDRAPDGIEPFDKLGQECIGRWLGALSRDRKGDGWVKGKWEGRGCDWVAYGLFRGPWFVLVPVPDEDGEEPGRTREIASFAVAEGPGGAVVFDVETVGADPVESVKRTKQKK